MSKGKVRYPKSRRNAAGHMLCRGCGKPVPPNRQTWCSNDCFKTRCPRMVRMAVRQRDQCVCAICGRDAGYILNAFCRMSRRQPNPWSRDNRVRRAAVKAGWPLDASRDWWEADHIIPHSEGGDCILSNMRTLCVPCHKAETAKLAARKAKERRWKNARFEQAEMKLEPLQK